MLDKLIETFRPKQRLTPEQYLAKLKARGLHPDGTPVLDPVPLAPPIGYKKHPTMVELIRDMVRSENLRKEALESGHETFEDAEDFDVGDEPETLRSPWENDFDPPLNEMLSAGREALADKAKFGGAGGEPPAPSPLAAPVEPPVAPPVATK